MDKQTFKIKYDEFVNFKDSNFGFCPECFEVIEQEVGIEETRGKCAVCGGKKVMNINLASKYIDVV